MFVIKSGEQLFLNLHYPTKTHISVFKISQTTHNYLPFT